MSVYVGFLVTWEGADERGIPLSAGTDYNQVFSDTFRRVVEMYGGKLQFCYDGIQVQERDITPEDAESINRIVADYFAKHQEPKP